MLETLLFIVIATIFIGVISLTKTKKVVDTKFPELWRKVLKENVFFYSTLNTEKKHLFEKRIQEFIFTKSITGHQTEVGLLEKLLVASSAVMMTLSFKRWNFNYLNNVVLVDGAVNKGASLKHGIVSGMIQTRGHKSEMVLSKSALIQGFKDFKDKHNVGIHEFAHVLDHADGDIDGVPKLIMPHELTDEWINLMMKKIGEIHDRKSDIKPYGGTNEAEFFAVLCEYFFEKPHILEERHPQVYKVLSETFQQKNTVTFKEKFIEMKSAIKIKIGRNQPCPCNSGKKYKKCCMLA